MSGGPVGQVSSYNTFRDTAFTKFHPFVCQRAVIKQGEIIQGKPKICVGYFSMRNPYMKFQDDISMPPPPPRTHTHGQAETNMSPTFSKLGAYKISNDPERSATKSPGAMGQTYVFL